MQDVLGIVGGFGGYATLDFFARVLKKFASESERGYPHIIMDNDFSMPSRTRALLTGEGYKEVVSAIASSMRILVHREGTKARYIVLPCGTSHYFLPDVYQLVPEAEERVVHAIRLLGDDLRARGVKDVLVIAAEGTLYKHFYRDCLHDYGIRVSEPPEAEYQEIRYFIECVKTDAYPVELAERFCAFLQKYEEKDVVLGCTEFPVLMRHLMERDGMTPSDVYVWRGRRFYDPLTAVLDFLYKNMV